MSSLGLQRLQTAIPTQQYGGGAYNGEHSDGQDLDGGGEYTARPTNAHNHSDALWFQPRDAMAQAPEPDCLAIEANPAAAAKADLNGSSAASNPQPSASTSASATAMNPQGLSRPLNPLEQDRLAQLDRLKFFLATAPARWDDTSAHHQHHVNMAMSMAGPSYGGLAGAGSHPALNRFLLPSQEFVTCVLWNGLYHITGTDIVRALVFR